MATALDLVNEWLSDDEDKQNLYRSKQGLVLRWLNQAQLRFADKSEILRSVWTPTITSSGNIALPTDFLREFPDRVFLSDKSNLKKIDHSLTSGATFSATTFYSIYNNTFYVWAASACSPTIPYIKKPTDFAISTIASGNLEFPEPVSPRLMMFMEYKFERYMKKMSLEAELKFLQFYDDEAWNSGMDNKLAIDGLITMRSSRF